MITTEQLDALENGARRALQHPETCSPSFLTLTRDVVLPLAAEVRRLRTLVHVAGTSPGHSLQLYSHGTCRECGQIKLSFTPPEQP